MVIIKEYSPYQEKEILSLYDSVGWTAYTDHPETLKLGFERSLLTLSAYESNELVGLIRTVGDGETVVLIQDLLVKPDHQRQGVGSLLLQTVLNLFSHVRQIQLVTDNTPKTMAFYRAMGFSQLSQIGCCGFMKV